MNQNMNIFIFHKIAKFEQIFIEKCKIKQNTKLKLYEEVRRKDNYTKQRRFLFMQKKKSVGGLKLQLLLFHPAEISCISRAVHLWKFTDTLQGTPGGQI